MVRCRGLRVVGVLGIALALLPHFGCTASPQRLDAVLWVGGFAHDFDAIADVLSASLPERIPVDITVARDGCFLDAAERPDVIIMDHCYKSTEGVINKAQQGRLLEWVRGGVGVVAIHASYYSFLEWDAYHELYGARFVKHGAVDVTLAVRTVDERHPIMKGLADRFEVVSELYESTPLADDCHVLAVAKEVDGTSEYPSVWVRKYGKGRVVTILPGHDPAAYKGEAFQKLIASSVVWAAGRDQ
jgi:type 1 glutamine amidotransferase